ncbi:MAG: DNA adenine methylase [Thermodesulfobacteriota bacterium]
MTVNRPVLRYHGGKLRTAPWIISHFPPHAVYVEPFGGAASVLLRKAPAKIEVFNDLNSRVVNCFRVLRDPQQAAELQRLLRLTPCAEEEYRCCLQTSPDRVEDARRLLVVGRQGHGSTAAAGGKGSGWRRASLHGEDIVRQNDWLSLWQEVTAWADRLRSVYLENREALEVIAKWDSPGTLFYVDPPYPACTRTCGLRGYRHEMSDEGHRRLAAALMEIKGMAVVSGYPSGLYQELYGSWVVDRKEVYADQRAKRYEMVWCNARAVAGLASTMPLFAAGGGNGR